VGARRETEGSAAVVPADPGELPQLGGVPRRCVWVWSSQMRRKWGVSEAVGGARGGSRAVIEVEPSVEWGLLLGRCHAGRRGCAAGRQRQLEWTSL